MLLEMTEGAVLSFRAKSRNLADNCTDVSVRSRIPPLRDAVHHFGRNDKIQPCFFCIPCGLGG